MRNIYSDPTRLMNNLQKRIFSLTKKAEKEYYATLTNNNKNDMKNLWEIYGNIFSKSKCNKKMNISCLKTEEEQLSYPHLISNVLN